MQKCWTNPDIVALHTQNTFRMLRLLLILTVRWAHTFLHGTGISTQPVPPQLPLSQVKNVKHTGNIKFEDILEIARIMRPRSCARSLAGTCKEMLGTAVSVGCTVDHKTPGEIMEMVSALPAVVATGTPRFLAC